ncbi:MAG: helix-turn-helix transcriptional regulator [Clostridia bacterium]|nr:helix-turn-helix transcriptional regulator [Clostridia bacterium]
MDQIKTGKFIAAMRKEKGLTQRQLADQLLISDKTVSKWETGNGLPEVSLMLPLCEALGINVNELLSGERLETASYQKKAEENIMSLMHEKEENKKRLIIANAVAFITLLGGLPLFMVAGLVELPLWGRIVLIALGMVILVCGIAVACELDRDAGVFECRKCGERFVPDLKSYIMAPHTITTRRLKCPHCGQKSYCKKRMTK